MVMKFVEFTWPSILLVQLISNLNYLTFSSDFFPFEWVQAKLIFSRFLLYFYMSFLHLLNSIFSQWLENSVTPRFCLVEKWKCIFVARGSCSVLGEWCRYHGNLFHYCQTMHVWYRRSEVSNISNLMKMEFSRVILSFKFVCFF